MQSQFANENEAEPLNSTVGDRAVRQMYSVPDTPIKNQGSCGACYAFGACAAFGKKSYF